MLFSKTCDFITWYFQQQRETIMNIQRGKHLLIFKSNKKIKTYLNKLNLFGVTQFKGIRRQIIIFLCRLRDQSFHRKCNFIVNKDKSKLRSAV